jgi:SAM-dependent methyltransferase
MEVDFGKTAADYGKYRQGFPDDFFRRIAAYGVGRSGQRVLDLGTGTGAVARGLALRGCEVAGVDKSGALIAQALRLDADAGVKIRYVLNPAEATGLPDRAFDAVTAGQCWHWFDRDDAAREVRRVIVPGGKFVIAHFDWVPLPGNIVEATEALITRYNPTWGFEGGTGFYPQWLKGLVVAGFRDIETFSFDQPVPYNHEAWRGRIRASAGVAASLPPEQVALFDRDLAALLQEKFPDEPLQTAHRCFTIVCTAP